MKKPLLVPEELVTAIEEVRKARAAYEAVSKPFREAKDSYHSACAAVTAAIRADVSDEELGRLYRASSKAWEREERLIEGHSRARDALSKAKSSAWEEFGRAFVRDSED